MDDALAQDIGSQRRSMNTNVLILVVMDDALAPNFLAFKAAKDTS